MVFLRFGFLVWLAFTAPVTGLSTPRASCARADTTRALTVNTSTRRTWFRQGLVGVIAATPFLSSTTSVLAYERRDVGGAGRSAVTAAFNEQAYETNNRLEREGFKLETQQEQQASLTAALADYAYAPSAGSTINGASSKTSKGSNSKSTSSKPASK